VSWPPTTIATPAKAGVHPAERSPRGGLFWTPGSSPGVTRGRGWGRDFSLGGGSIAGPWVRPEDDEGRGGVLAAFVRGMSGWGLSQHLWARRYLRMGPGFRRDSEIGGEAVSWPATTIATPAKAGVHPAERSMPRMALLDPRVEPGVTRGEGGDATSRWVGAALRVLGSGPRTTKGGDWRFVVSSGRDLGCTRGAHRSLSSSWPGLTRPFAIRPGARAGRRGL